MEQVLFEEVPAENRAYRKTVIYATVVGGICSAFFLTMAIVELCLIHEFSTPIWGIVLFVLFILFILFGVWTAYLGISALCSRRQFIRIYNDRIVYRKQFQKAEQVLRLRPQDYKIRLYRTLYSLRGLSYLHKSAIEFVFWDADGNTLLSYISPTLYASRSQSPRFKWEDDLLLLGCEIIDYEKIIVNK